MINTFVSAFVLLNQLLTTGIAITAFSLLLYALTFNLKDRVARSFAFILACMTLVFAADAVNSIVTSTDLLNFILRLQWVGIIFLPIAYFYSSDALLATTGKPSRGRRRLVIKISAVISLIFLLLLPTPFLVGQVVQSLDSAPYLKRTWLTWIFTSYYAGMMIWSWLNFWRAYRRTTTRLGHRRLIYLMAGATAPAIGSFPFLLFGEGVALGHHLLFWITVVILNIGTGFLVIIMAYAVAFFGVDWPDRIIKSRLFRWLFRGPVTAIIVLTVTTFVRTLGRKFGGPYQTIEIILTVGSILIMQYLITLISPWIERKLLYRGDYKTLMILQEMQLRVLTSSDLHQFLESILSAACDRLQSTHGFIADLSPEGLDILVVIDSPHHVQDVPLDAVYEVIHTENDDIIFWDGYWLIPLISSQLDDNGQADERNNLPPSQQLLGVMGIALKKQDEYLISPNKDQIDHQSLIALAERASLALENQSAQQRLFSAFEDIAIQADLLQHLRAASRYDGNLVLTTPLPTEIKIPGKVIKDALNHYWGGPKLTQSSLLELNIVQTAILTGETPANALRSILRNAIEQTRPHGERRYTSDWILYNILEMKYVEGHKVRDIADRLAISEADFYRKQRTALKSLANILQHMEKLINAEQFTIMNKES